MIELPHLPPSAELIGRILLITIAALAGFLALRAAVRISVRHLLERRFAEAGDGVLPPAELERRVGTVGRLVVRVAGSLIAVIAVLMAFGVFGIDIGPAVAGLGVVGIAVGLGAQTLVKDWLAGVFVVLENQYSQGDVIRIAGVEGVVEDFSMRRTVLRDLDGTMHSVPNGQVIVASNLTRVWAPIDEEIDVAPGSDLARAAEIASDIARRLHGDPDWTPRLMAAPTVMPAEGRAGEGASIRVLGQARAAEQRAVVEELRTRIQAALDGAALS